MANATILYACTEGGLFIFNKPGTLNEWLPPRVGLPEQRVIAAWAEPGPPIRVVAATSDPAGEAHISLSENGGRDWANKLDAPVTALLGPAGEPARLYAGMEGGGLAVSVDAGNDWSILPGTESGSAIRGIFNTGDPGLFYLLVDGPEGDRLLEGNPDEGEWRLLAIEDVNAFAWEPDSGDLYAATSEGIAMSADKGATWPPLPGSPQGGRVLAAIPGPAGMNPTILVGTEDALLASNDAGASWQDVGFPRPGIAAVVRDPERRDRVYAATTTGYILESGNRGQNWQPVNREAIPPITYIYAIRI